MNYLKVRLLDRQEYLNLFLLIAFPIHLWSFVVIFQEGDWFSHRTNVYDTLGLLSYAGLTAIIESIIVFAFFFILAFMLPAQWNSKKRLSTLGYLYLVVLLGAMSSQWFFLIDRSLGTFAFRVIYNLNRFYSITLPLLVVGFLGGVIGVLFLQNRFSKLIDIMLNLMERASLVSYIYLILDVISVGIIILRNI